MALLQKIDRIVNILEAPIETVKLVICGILKSFIKFNSLEHPEKVTWIVRAVIFFEFFPIIKVNTWLTWCSHLSKLSDLCTSLYVNFTSRENKIVNTD